MAKVPAGHSSVCALRVECIRFFNCVVVQRGQCISFPRPATELVVNTCVFVAVQPQSSRGESIVVSFVFRVRECSELLLRESWLGGKSGGGAPRPWYDGGI